MSTPNTQIITTVLFDDDVNTQHDLIRIFVNDFFASETFEQMAAFQQLDQTLVNNIAVGLTLHIQKMYDIGELHQKIMIASINASGSHPEHSIDNILHLKIQISLQ